jgi:hypothetical protein
MFKQEIRLHYYIFFSIGIDTMYWDASSPVCSKAIADG